VKKINFRFGDDAGHFQAINALQAAEKLFPLNIIASQNREYALAELIPNYRPKVDSFNLINIMINKFGGQKQIPYLKKQCGLAETYAERYSLWVKYAGYSLKLKIDASFEEALLEACRSNVITMPLLEKSITMQLPLTVKFLLHLASLKAESIVSFRLMLISNFNIKSLRIYLNDFNEDQLKSFLYDPVIPGSNDTLFSRVAPSVYASYFEKLLKASPFLLKNLLEDLVKPCDFLGCSRLFYLLANNNQFIINLLLQVKPDLWAAMPASAFLEKNWEGVPIIFYLFQNIKNISYFHAILSVKQEEIVNCLNADDLYQKFPFPPYSYKTFLAVVLFHKKEYDFLINIFKRRPELIDPLSERIIKTSTHYEGNFLITAGTSLEEMDFSGEKVPELLWLILSHSQPLFQRMCAIFCDNHIFRSGLISKLARSNIGCKILNAVLINSPEFIKKERGSLISASNVLNILGFPEGHALLKNIYTLNHAQLNYLNLKGYHSSVPVIAKLSRSNDGVTLAILFYTYKPELLELSDLLKIEDKTHLPFLYRVTGTPIGINLLASLAESTNAHHSRWYATFKREKINLGKIITVEALCKTDASGNSCLYNLMTSRKGCHILRDFFKQQPGLLPAILKKVDENREEAWVKKLIQIKNDNSLMEEIKAFAPTLAEVIEALGSVQTIERQPEREGSVSLVH